MWLDGYTRLVRAVLNGCLLLAPLAAIAQPIHAELHTWEDRDRGDMLATTEPAWQGRPGQWRSPNYRFVRNEGLVFHPARPRPPNTVPLSRWYSPLRGDNFTTSDPAWQGAAGDVRPSGCVPEREAGCYRFVRLEGFVFDPLRAPPAGTVGLFGWYQSGLQDNYATTDRRWAATRGAADRKGFRFVRREGYLVPPAAGADAVAYVPVYFHFVQEGVDPATGLPSYRDGAETMLDIDAALRSANEALDRARGRDARRLQLVRAGLRYVRMETLSARWRDTCPAAEVADPGWADGEINVVLTGRCTSESYAVTRSDAISLRHELGHALGIVHTFGGNDAAATVELLHRELEPEAAASCYRRGDFLCDTPPDYGYEDAGSLDMVRCDGSGHADPLPVECTQVGPPCGPSEALIDARGICTTRGASGERTYDPVRLGLRVGHPVNAMSYAVGFETGYFTYEQFLRMHAFVQWRRHRAGSVPEDERALFSDFWVDEGPSDRRRLAYARRVEPAVTVEPPADLRFGVLARELDVTSAPADRVLAARLDIEGSGVPSGSARVRLAAPDGRAAVVTGSALNVAADRIVVDEIYAAVQLAPLRGARAPGRWRVEVQDPGGSLRVGSVRLSLVTAGGT
jgi:hypothetical protein